MKDELKKARLYREAFALLDRADELIFRARRAHEAKHGEFAPRKKAA